MRLCSVRAKAAADAPPKVITAMTSVCIQQTYPGIRESRTPLRAYRMRCIKQLWNTSSSIASNRIGFGIRTRLVISSREYSNEWLA